MTPRGRPECDLCGDNATERVTFEPLHLAEQPGYRATSMLRLSCRSCAERHQRKHFGVVRRPL